MCASAVGVVMFFHQEIRRLFASIDFLLQVNVTQPPKRVAPPFVFSSHIQSSNPLGVGFRPRNETQEVNRLLANPEHFAAWTRVAEDPDTMHLAKSIGDFLG